MTTGRPSEPIAPATIPGEPLDPKIPEDEREESEEERPARESEVAFDQARVRIPPG
jgi:hypothetical protein